MAITQETGKAQLGREARKITTEAVLVTPEMARQWLEGNVHNRTIRDSVVHRYAEDMKTGRWGLTHQGIAFDGDGRLIDGQHRLWAIVESDTSVWLMVSRDVPESTQQYIDEGVPRSAVDVLKLADPDSSTSNYKMATARRMLIGTRTQVITSRSELIAFYQKHERAVMFAVDDAFGGKRVNRVNPACVAAVVARASYHEDKDRLREFGAATLSGMPKSDKDTCAILLRNWLLGGGQDRGIRLSRDMLIYGKAQRAVLGFLRGEIMRSIYYVKDELWTIPGEVRRLKPGQVIDPKARLR